MLNQLLVRLAGLEVGIGSAHRMISASRLDSAMTYEFHAATSPVKAATGEPLLSGNGQGRNQKNGNHWLSADAKASIASCKG